MQRQEDQHDYVLVENVDKAASGYTFLTIALAHAFSGDSIVWSEHLPDEKQRRSSIAFEGDRWVLRDGFGQIYDIH
jgi:hypothetical protein